jgi:hypothetical protein
MISKFRIVPLAVLLVGAVAQADEWNKESAVTFSAPVQVPGQVLPPGRYVFKLAGSSFAGRQTDRHVVQILNEDQTQVIATIPAIPAYRLKRTNETLITFEDRPNGSEAVKRWFYPGGLSGVAFLYPE